MNPRIRGSSDSTSYIRPSVVSPHFLPGTRLHTLLSATNLSPWARRRLSSLARESHSEIFWSDLLTFGRSAEGEGELSLALAVYQEIAREDPDPSRRETAEVAAAALQGVGSRAGDRLEHLSHGFLSQATDPALLLGMTGAGLGFRGGRALSARILRRWGVEEAFGTWGLRSFSALGGFGVEVPAFVLSEKLGRGLMGERVSWEGKTLVEDLGPAALVLGALRLGGWGSGALLRRWPLGAAGVPWGGRDFYLGATRVLPTMGMYGGILLGQNLAESWRGEVTERDWWLRLLDGGVTLLQFQATGGLLQGLSPRGTAAGPLNPEPFLPSRESTWTFPHPGLIWAGAGRAENVRLPNLVLMEQGEGNRGGGGKAKSPGKEAASTSDAAVPPGKVEAPPVPEVLRGLVDPAFWFATHVMPPEVGDWVHRYWDEVYQELGQWGLKRAETPMDGEAMLGHSLARVYVRGRERLKEAGPEDPAAPSLARTLNWIDTWMNRSTLDPFYHRLLDQFEWAKSNTENTRWFWNSLPLELQSEVLAQARISATREFQESPVFLAQALAQTVVAGRLGLHEYSSLHESLSPLRAPYLSIEEALLHLSEELSEQSPSAPGAVRLAQDLWAHFQEEVARLSRPEILASFQALDGGWRQTWRQAHEAEEARLTEERPELGWHRRNLLAYGKVIGGTLSRLYAGLLDLAVQKQLVTGNPFSIPREEIRNWRQAEFSDLTWEVFLEVSPQTMSWEPYLEMLDQLQDLKWRWGEANPFFLALSEEFAPGKTYFSLSERLGQIPHLIGLMKSATVLRLSREWHPEIRRQVEANSRFLPQRFTQKPERRLARALALTAAQSNGLLGVRPGLAKYHFWDLVPPREQQRLGWQPLPPMDAAKAQRFQRWFRAMAGQIQGESELSGFAHRLSRELANYSGPEISDARCMLPDMVDQGLMEEFLILRSDLPLQFPYELQMKELGRGLGKFLRMAYQDIFRLGEEKGWIDPVEFDLLENPGGYFYGETPYWVLWEGIDPPYIRSTLVTQKWLFDHLWRWGGEIHPMYQGFAETFYEEALSETQPLRLRLGAQVVLDKLMEGG